MSPELPRADQRAGEHVDQLRALQAAAARSRSVLDAVLTISLACRGITTFRAIFESTAHEIQQLFGCDSCLIAVAGAAQPMRFEAALVADADGSRYAEQMPADPWASAVVEAGTPTLLRDLPADASVRCWLAVPLRIGPEVCGLIAIQSSLPDTYGQPDVEDLQHLASVVGVALENVRLDQQQRRLGAALSDQVTARTVELTILNALAAELVQQHALPQKLERALDLIVPLFGLEGGAVRLLDARREQLGLLAYLGFDPAYIREAQTIPLTDNTIGAAVRENRPIAVPHGMRANAAPSLPQPYPFDAMLIVPLRSGERVLGTLALVSRQPRSFTQQEIDLAQTAGNQIATAIENSTLFAEQERQIRELDVIGRVGKLISASFDFEEMLAGVYQALHELTEASVFYLLICDAATQVVTNAIFIEEGQRIPLEWTGRPPHPGSLTAWVMREGAPLLFEDLAVQRGELAALGVTPQPVGPENPVRSWIGVPLLAKDREPIGVLSLQDYAARRYDAQTVAFLGQVASHISLGVQKIRLYAESLRRVERELAIAREIQSNLFPHSLPTLPGLTLDARCLPARETGGDFYDFVALDDAGGTEATLGIVVGDVSGKSIPAAMLMAVARSIARSEARDHRTPQDVVRETNALVSQDVPPRAFVAMSYATLDLPRRRLALSNAGQLTPLRRSADGRVTYLEVPGPTLPLGIMPEIAYQALELTLDPGDLLVFVTDGIVEAKNRTRQLFGFEHLEHVIQQHGHLPPRAFVDRLLAEVGAFMDGAPQHDDMTIVVLRID